MYYQKYNAKVYTGPEKWKVAHETSKVINEKISLYEPTRFKKYIAFLKSVERVVTGDELKDHGELELNWNYILNYQVI